MEPVKAKRLDDDKLIDEVLKAAYISFARHDILKLEELIRRYRNAITGRSPE